MPENFPSNNNISEQFINEQIPVGLPWRLLIFSAFLLGFSIFIYFGLRLGYESYLDTQAKGLDKKFAQLASQVSQQDQKHFINFYSQLVNLKKVLENHQFSSNVFGFLEKNTIPTVFYYEADFIVEENILKLKGQADSAETLAQQLNVFDKTEELESAVLDQMTFERGPVGFNLTLTFNKEFFNSPKL